MRSGLTTGRWIISGNTYWCTPSSVRKRSSRAWRAETSPGRNGRTDMYFWGQWLLVRQRSSSEIVCGGCKVHIRGAQGEGGLGSPASILNRRLALRRGTRRTGRLGQNRGGRYKRRRPRQARQEHRRGSHNRCAVGEQSRCQGAGVFGSGAWRSRVFLPPRIEGHG